MNLFKSLVIAFSMYSKLPMPQFEWKEESMKYALGFFPCVGVVVGVVQCLWSFLFMQYMDNLPIGFYAAIATVIPVLITGGIHVDGFMDTIDAKSSYQSKERRLEILKDAHLGAFAVIYAIVYFIITYGCFQLANSKKTILLIGISYVISRCFSGIAAVLIKAAKKDGSLVSFTKAADKRFVLAMLLLQLLLAIGYSIALNPLVGAAELLFVIVLFFYYKQMAMKDFGGITGDLEGWFLQMAELGMLLLIAIF